MYRYTSRKRYRSADGRSLPIKVFRNTPKRTRRYVKGFIRRSGYYGRFIKSRITKNPELKFFDTVNAGNTISQAGEVMQPSLNDVDVGGGQNQMIGRQITIKSISGFIQLGRNSQTETSLTLIEQTETARVALILDKQSNGATPTWAAIYQVLDIHSPLNMMNTKRFKVLKEWIHTSNATVNAYVANVAPPTTTVTYFRAEDFAMYKFYLPVNITIDYAPQAGSARALSEIRSNNLIVAAISESGSVYYSCYIRIRYSDC